LDLLQLESAISKRLVAKIARRMSRLGAVHEAIDISEAKNQLQVDKIK